MSTYAGLALFRVYTASGKHVIHVPAGEGEPLRAHLASNAIGSAVRRHKQAPYDRLEVERDVSAATLQATVDRRSRTTG